MKKTTPFFFVVSLWVSVVSCTKPDCGCAPPLGSELMGRWEWTKTVTPTQTLTPQTTGYKRSFYHKNDNGRDYIAFYQNDSLQVELTMARDFYRESRSELTVVEQFGQKYLKYYLIRGTNNVTNEIQLSNLLNSYEDNTDLTRHYYRFIGN